MKHMMVILCNSFQDAKDAYDIFVDFLERTDPFSIIKCFDSSYCVEADGDLRYIFVDYRMVNAFDDCLHDVIELDEFFEVDPWFCDEILDGFEPLDYYI